MRGATPRRARGGRSAPPTSFTGSGWRTPMAERRPPARARDRVRRRVDRPGSRGGARDSYARTTRATGRDRRDRTCGLDGLDWLDWRSRASGLDGAGRRVRSDRGVRSERERVRSDRGSPARQERAGRRERREPAERLEPPERPDLRARPELAELPGPGARSDLEGDEGGADPRGMTCLPGSSRSQSRAKRSNGNAVELFAQVAD